MRPDAQHLRGLALMCVVLTLLGVLALVRDDPRTEPVTRRRATFVAAGGADDGGTGQVGAAELPEPALPLFPTTSTTRATKTTSSVAPTTRAVGEPVLKPPALGSYTYSVSGTESLAASGKRALPGTMTLTAHRPSGQAADEVTFDLRFSAQHTEQEVVSYRADMIGVRQQAAQLEFGLAKRNTFASYKPAVVFAAVPFVANASRSGASETRDGAGRLLRIEDWKVTDVGLRSIVVAGATVSAWEVSFDRASRAGAAESLRETRRAWFDPVRRMWVKWETHLHTERPNELASAYDLDYVATLSTS